MAAILEIAFENMSFALNIRNRFMFLNIDV